MKKNLTLRSLCTAFFVGLLAFSTTAKAQEGTGSSEPAVLYPGLYAFQIEGEKPEAQTTKVYLDQEGVIKIHILGEHLTEDVTIDSWECLCNGAVNTGDQCKLSTTTLKKADLETKTGALLEITYKFTGVTAMRTLTLNFVSADFPKQAHPTPDGEQAEPSYDLSWSLYISVLSPYTSLQALFDDAENVAPDAPALVENDIVITHVYTTAEGTSEAYAQDATAGVILHQVEDLNCKTDDHFAHIQGYLASTTRGYELEINREAKLDTPSKTEAATPIEVTVPEVEKYLNRLVVLRDVVLIDRSESKFEIGRETWIEDLNEKQVLLSVFPGSDLLGTPISSSEEKIDLVGIVRIENGKLTVAPRSLSDITFKPSISLLQTGMQYFSRSIYIGSSNSAEFYVGGRRLTEDITLSVEPIDDDKATCSVSPATLDKNKVNAPTGSPMVNVKMTPSKITKEARFKVTATSAGAATVVREVVFEVKDSLPEINVLEADNPYGKVYVGETYETTLFLGANRFTRDNVTLEIPEGSDIVSIVPSEVTVKDLNSYQGAEILVTFRPSKATVGDKTAKTTFPFIAKTKGLPEGQVIEDVFVHVLPNTPAVELGRGTVMKDIYQNTEFTHTLTLTGNPYVKGTVTLEKVHADIVSFDPATITEKDLKEGKDVTVTIKPTELVSEWISVGFRVKGEGLDTVLNIRYNEVQEALPKVELTAPGYFAESAMVGKEFNVELTVKGNPFVTDEVTFYSDDDQVTKFTPASLTAKEAKDGAKVIVTIVPKTVSKDEWTRQPFVVKAKTAGAKADAETTILFVVGAAHAKIEMSAWPAFATVGQPIEVEVEVFSADVTSDIHFSSDDIRITKFEPETITADQAHQGTSIFVTIVPTEASADENDLLSFRIKATTEGVDEPSEYILQLLVTKPETALTDISNNAITLWNEQNITYIRLTEAATVQILDITGRTITSGKYAAGVSTFHLTQGLYLVKVNDTVTKWIVK